MPNFLPGTPDNIDVAKAQARRLATALKDTHPVKHGQALELVARLHGQTSWGALQALIKSENADNDLTPSGFEVEEATSPELIPVRTDGHRVLFRRTTAEHIYHLARALLKCDDHYLAILYPILQEVEGGRYLTETKSLLYFEKLTIEDLFKAATRVMEKNQEDKRILWLVDRIVAVFRDGWTFPHGSREDLQENYAYLDKQFGSMRPFETAEIEGPRISPGRHAIYTGSDLAPLRKQFPAAIDLTRQDRNDRLSAAQTRLARVMRAEIPANGFSNSALCAKIACALRLGWPLLSEHKVSVEVSRKSVGPKRTTIILALSDMVAAGGADILMAQARACGLTVIVWADIMSYPANIVSSAFANAFTLIEPSGANGGLQFRSPVLDESAGGHLKLPTPGRPLDWKDRARNALIRRRLEGKRASLRRENMRH